MSYGSSDIIRATSLTYRQVNHAVTRGWLNPLPTTRRGVGTDMEFSAGEWWIARTAAALLDAGFSAISAWRYARECHGDRAVRTLAGGLVYLAPDRQVLTLVGGHHG